MTDGVEIRLRGRLAFYGPQGQFQLKMTSIDPELHPGSAGHRAGPDPGRLAARRSAGRQRRRARWPAAVAHRGGHQRGQRGRSRLRARAREQRPGRSPWWWPTPGYRAATPPARWSPRWPVWWPRRRRGRGGPRRRGPHRPGRLRRPRAGPGHRHLRRAGPHRHRPRDRLQRGRPGGPAGPQDPDRLRRPSGGPGPTVPPPGGRDLRAGGPAGRGLVSTREQAPGAPATPCEAARAGAMAVAGPATASTSDADGSRGPRRRPRSTAALRLDALAARTAAVDPARSPGPGMVDHPDGRRPTWCATPTTWPPGRPWSPRWPGARPAAG